ncbi:MbeD/MobD family mobilization/exclusion protein, partial [Klebsiella variicola]|uniref:MbeD/MobD family mobilization/exclusion protein n=1 Tax=Klebsiella variicola TaxID=244366 RepID=UPI00115D70D1
MTELEKQLLAALEQMQEQQREKEEALRQMFDQKQAENWSNLTKHVSDLSGQLKDFERQNRLLNNQLST